MIQWCVDHRVKVVLATVGVFALSIVGFGHVQQQFFPLSERPELFLQLRLPEGTAFDVTEKSVKKAEALLKDDKDIATYTAYVGQGSPRFWLGLNPQLPNEAFAEIVIVAKDVEARERIKARLEKAVDDGALTRGARARRPLQFRPAGRLPRAVPRDRPGHQHGARHRLQGARRGAAERQGQGSAARLERAVAVPEAGGRSGPRPRARPDPAGRLAGAEHADLGRAGHHHARRHREGRRGRARGAVRTARPRPCRRSHRHLAQRRRGAAVADRQDRIRPRGADPVAAQPRHGDHGARRRRRRRAGARRHQPDLAEAAGDPRQPRAGLPDRDGRRVRGIRQGQCLDLRAVSADGASSC